MTPKLKRIGWVPYCVKAPSDRKFDLGVWRSWFSGSRKEAVAACAYKLPWEFEIIPVYAAIPKP